MVSEEDYQKALEREGKFYLKSLCEDNSGFRCVLVESVKDSLDKITYIISGAAYTLFGDFRIFSDKEVDYSYDFGKEISREEYIDTVREAIGTVEKYLQEIEREDDISF